MISAKSPEPTVREAFANGRTLSAFQCHKVLRFDGGGNFVVLQGDIEGNPALIQLKQKAACDSKEEFVASLGDFQLNLTNYSGAEYSNYLGAGLGATFDIEVICPASERQIQRKIPSEKLLVEETSEIYFKTVREFSEVQSLHIGWLDAVVNLETELERNLFHNDRFVINVDTKWTTHPQMTTDDRVRASWHGQQWTDGLYLLAIVKDPVLKSIRDLKGEQGALLCEEMRDELRTAAERVYGVNPSQLRIMFHYHPQFYRLHAHCVRINAINPGSETERAHLLTTVANNLRMNEDYYSLCTLSYSVRVGERLHQLLEANNGEGFVKNKYNC